MTKQEYEQLKQTIAYHMDRYYNQDNPEISDYEYDTLMQSLKQAERENPEWITPDSPSQRVGGSVKRTAGVKVDFLTVPQYKGRGRVEALWHSTLEVFERQFERHGRKWLPDLIFFTDDHCFQGAVVSLLSRGVRVPRDVRIVSMTNAGMRPPFTCSLACLELDLDASANVVSKAMLEFLVHGRRVESGCTIGCAYVPGGTFG